MIALIAAYAKNRVIGRDGQIPWQLPGEQGRFRELTTGKIVVMGRRTYEEIGRPLPDRQTILISKTLRVETENCTTVDSLAEALALAGDRDVFIAGGEQLYREALPLADVLYLTTVEAEIQGDRYFPAFDPVGYEVEQGCRVDGDIPYTYWTYRRKVMSMAAIDAYLQQVQQSSGIVLGLAPMGALLARLGNPQDKTRYFHIAGTNGKGSTGAMLRTVLRKAGYRVGHYASPAVFDPMEPWWVDGHSITEDDYTKAMTRIIGCREAMLLAGEQAPTVFEMETALAFCTFAKERCDFAVLECGMGGGEDATNVVETTVASLITAVGLDHTRFLGKTLEEIAANKGGIIKDGVPLVVQKQSREVEAVLESLCRQHHSPMIVPDPAQLETAFDGDSTVLRYKGKTWRLALQGKYQGDNAAQVIETVSLLRSMGIAISDAALAEGLAETCWPGRFETVMASPRFILDGAHNPNAAKRLRENLDALRESGWQGRLFLIIGVLADKDFRETVSYIAPLGERVYAVTPDNPRALPGEQLAACAREFCPAVQAVTLQAAVSSALAEAGADDVILAFGSLSYLGALRRIIEKKRGE